MTKLSKERFQELAGVITEQKEGDVAPETMWPSREDEEEAMAQARAEEEESRPRMTVVDDEEYIGGRRAPVWMRADYDPKDDPYLYLDDDPYKDINEQVEDEPGFDVEARMAEPDIPMEAVEKLMQGKLEAAFSDAEEHILNVSSDDHYMGGWLDAIDYLREKLS